MKDKIMAEMQMACSEMMRYKNQGGKPRLCAYWRGVYRGLPP